MKKLIILALFGVLLTNCQKKTNTDKIEISALYPAPKSYPINLGEGYSKNIHTGAEIKPIVTSKRDTIVTGKPIAFKGTVVPFAKGREYQLTTKTNNKIAAFTNRFLAKDPTIYPLTDSNKTVKSNRHIIFKGDTLSTGIPIPFKGKKIALRQPNLVKAKPMFFRDQALYNIQNLDVLQGMASAKVYDLCLSKKGGLWLATYNGISHYDGQSFVHYSRKEGLPNGNVRAILEDRKGNIWFSPMGKGVCKFDGDSLMIFDQNIGIKGNSIWPIIEDSKGNIWWGSSLGLAKYDGKQIIHYTTNEGLSQNLIESIYEDRKGNIWIGTSNRGVNRFDGKRFEQYTYKQGLPLARVYAILEDKQGNMWFGSNGRGVVKFDGKRFFHYTKSAGMSGMIVRSLSEDKQGHIWMATSDGGLNKFDGQHFFHFTDREGLGDNYILKMIKDQQDNLWLGTYKSGLIKCDLNTFSKRKIRGNTTEEVVRAFWQDKQQRLLLLSQLGGLVRYDGKTFIAPDSTAFFANKPAYDVLQDKNGAVWLAIFGGLIKYEGNKMTHYMPNVIVRALLEDREGNLWIGTQGYGLYKYDGAQLTKFANADGLPHMSISTLLEDKQGNIWIGTEHGLSKYDGRSLINFSAKEGLSDPLIMTLYEDAQGFLWIGTYSQGLMRFDGKQVTCYTTREGLSDNLVKSIIQDKQGSIWVGTEKGLNRLSGLKATNAYQIQQFGQVDGLKALDFEANSAFLDKNEVLWWGTGKSVLNLDTKTYNFPAKQPQVSLKQLAINEQFLDYRNLSDSIRQFVDFEQVAKFANYPVKLTLPYDFNHLTFYFTTQNLNQAHKIKYSYKIDRIDEQWSIPSEQPVAEYRNLPYGRFTLQVKAIGQSQIWSKTFEYQFTIRPPWWHTWWFRLAYILVGVLAVAGYVRWRTYSLKRRQKMLEQTIEEHTRDLKESNEELIQLSEHLKTNKEEIVALKEKEKELLEEQVKTSESEFLLTMKSVQEKFNWIQTIKDDFSKALNTNDPNELKTVEKELQKFLNATSDIDILSNRIESRYPGILAELNTLFPNLTPNEIKHCILIKLNLSVKEAAQLLSVSTHAVKMARKRLRKKMNIPEEIPLKDFLHSPTYYNSEDASEKSSEVNTKNT
ncbi:hypothetical protein BKI52_23260 [marine bacterium AO1-C]|nr:hypothetical protein BKI52_23260 [marine bacterium AO1-C]